MKILSLNTLLLLLLATVTLACGGETAEAGSSNANIFRNPDYEDTDTDGSLTYQDQSTAQDSITDETSNPITDPYKDPDANGMIKPKYTDNEYEAAYTTSTTEPKNVVATKHPRTKR